MYVAADRGCVIYIATAHNSFTLHCNGGSGVELVEIEGVRVCMCVCVKQLTVEWRVWLGCIVGSSSITGGLLNRRRGGANSRVISR